MLQTPAVRQIAASWLPLVRACAVADFDTTPCKTPGTPGLPAVVEIETPADGAGSDATRAVSMTLAVALAATVSAVVIVTGGAAAAGPMQAPFASELASSLGFGSPAALEEQGRAGSHTFRPSSLRQRDRGLRRALA